MPIAATEIATFTFLSFSGASLLMGAHGPNKGTVSAFKIYLSTPVLSPRRRAAKDACTIDSYAVSIALSFSGSVLYKSFFLSKAFFIASASAP